VESCSGSGITCDTDAIIPGRVLPFDGVEDLGAKAFAYVKPDFVARVKAGENIVVAGEGWGSGARASKPCGPCKARG
jgi:3-isopropylmalate dehydratase small subunit